MATTYTTVTGDTWDLIALKVYGDEKYTTYLMENNVLKLSTFVFSTGVVLKTPALSEELENDVNLPEWRK